MSSLGLPCVDENHGRGNNSKSRKLRKQRDRLFQEQRGKCWWCQKPMEQNRLRYTPTGKLKDNPAFSTFEHILPLSMLGPDNLTNKKLVHATCNRNRHKLKWEHDPIDWNKVPKLHMLGQVKVYYWEVLKESEHEFTGTMGLVAAV